MQIFDLKASRCPDAMLYIRRAIDAASKGMFTGELEIRTIEQSIERDLPYYVAQIEHVTIVDVHSTSLSESTKVEWVENDDAIEDDVSDVHKQIIFKLSFTPC
ncbi:hypothetical protein GCM10011607_11800 [Shewanella inventionis]|uniref:Uncharacterized protein n=1 Tax=Shewanella inventionis TaxID=1738770 RepID=A0ABQ1IUT2_9GAMM|nr:hypothetical protein [Shewanella inventionis]GGB52943.1 hypothetical protein GCM10011607_11800 [Shewanella inventionis]